MMKLSVVVGVVLAVGITICQANISDFFRNQDIEEVEYLGSKTVYWNQGSSLDFGGDQHDLFLIYTYRLGNNSNRDVTFPIFIQDGYHAESTKINGSGSFKYGMQNGLLFLVIIDPANKPYQHRFKTNTLQNAAYTINSYLTDYVGINLSWIAGDYLRDIMGESSMQSKHNISNFFQNQDIELVKWIGSTWVNHMQQKHGDMKLWFNLFKYRLQINQDVIFAVFIQHGSDAESTIKINDPRFKFKYGMVNGLFFLVLIDPRLPYPDNKPNQTNFETNLHHVSNYTINSYLTNNVGINLSWIAGDYLRDL